MLLVKSLHRMLMLMVVWAVRLVQGMARLRRHRPDPEFLALGLGSMNCRLDVTRRRVRRERMYAARLAIDSSGNLRPGLGSVASRGAEIPAASCDQSVWITVHLRYLAVMVKPSSQVDEPFAITAGQLVLFGLKELCK